MSVNTANKNAMSSRNVMSVQAMDSIGGVTSKVINNTGVTAIQPEARHHRRKDNKETTCNKVADFVTHDSCVT